MKHRKLHLFLHHYVTCDYWSVANILLRPFGYMTQESQGPGGGGGPNPLTTSLSASAVSVNPGVSVTFTTSDSGGTPPVSHVFSYGDGTSDSTGSHSYTNAGTYVATETATDSGSPAQSATSNSVSITVGTIAKLPPTKLSGSAKVSGTTVIAAGYLKDSKGKGVPQQLIDVHVDGQPISGVITDNLGEWDKDHSGLAKGSHSISFHYNGDPDYGPSNLLKLSFHIA